MGKGKRDVELLMLALDDVVMEKQPTCDTLLLALERLYRKYKKDIENVGDNRLYSEIREMRQEQLKIPYTVLSKFD